MIKNDGEIKVCLTEMFELSEIIGCLKQIDKFPPNYLSALIDLRNKMLNALTE